MAGRRGLGFFAAVAAAVALGVVLAPPAAAGPRLDWSESATISGHSFLRFEVNSITVGKSSWSAHISFRNLSKRTLRVGNVFGLALYRGSGITPTSMPDALGHATKFSPARPERLAPGASWDGVIAGRGKPQAKLTGKLYGRIVFGPFFGVPGWPRGYVWITDHSRTFTFETGRSGELVI